MCPPIRSARSDSPREREPLVPRLVDLLLERDAVELAAQPLARRRPGLGPGDALRAVLVAGQLLELAQLRDGAGRLERHAATLPPPRRQVRSRRREGERTLAVDGRQR